MEHEDNTHFENYLQNAQHHMDGLQINNDGCGGIGGGDNVTAEQLVAAIGGGISNVVGGKFEEQDDDEEWKYIKEGQQSEKDFKESEGGHNLDSFVGQNFQDGLLPGHGDDGAGNNLLGNGFNSGNFLAGNPSEEMGDFYTKNFASGNSMDEDVEVIKNDGDFSTTSNTTSTAGDDDLLHQANNFQNFEEPQKNDLLQGNINDHLDDEEGDLNSAATTTNGTSSLSENAGLVQMEQPNESDLIGQEIEGQEAFQNPFGNDFEAQAEKVTTPPAYNLNPNAPEFSPSFKTLDQFGDFLGDQQQNLDFGMPPSTEAAPNDPFHEEDFENLSPHKNELSDDLIKTEGEVLSSVPHHLAIEDDFIALSPRKGRVADMDGINVPKEEDFDYEVSQRPHELEKEDDLSLQNLETTNGSLVLNQEEPSIIASNFSSEQNHEENEDCLDYQKVSSPISDTFMDHGPETCVDQENDLLIEQTQQKEDVMKQSLYVENPIEDLLNSVQPLPNDLESANSSFIEPETKENDPIDMEIKQEIDLANKELFNVEEKEHISQSPSTEELDMNFKNNQNDFFNQREENDFLEEPQQQEIIPEPEILNETEPEPEVSLQAQQLPLDMKESFYMENTSSENQNFEDNSDFFAKEDQANGDFGLQSEEPIQTLQNNLTFEENFISSEKVENEELLSPCSAAEEKHLMEDTKENLSNYLTEEIAAQGNAVSAESFQQLEDQFENLNLANDSNNGIIPNQDFENVAEQSTDAISKANVDDFLMQNDEQTNLDEKESDLLNQEEHQEPEPLAEPVAEPEPQPEPEPETEQAKDLLFNNDYNQSFNQQQEFFNDERIIDQVYQQNEEISSPVVETLIEKESHENVLEEVPATNSFTEETVAEPEITLPVEQMGQEALGNDEIKSPELAEEALDEKIAETSAENTNLEGGDLLATAAVALAATTAVAATAAAVSASKEEKKPEPVAAKKTVANKSTTTAAAKPKVSSTSTGAAKKPSDLTKKPVEPIKKTSAATSTAAAAKARPLAAKPSTLAAKTSSTVTSTTRAKPLPSAAKPAASRTSTSRPATAPAASASKPAAKPSLSAARTTSASTAAARKPATSTTSLPAKPRATSSSLGTASKPTSLNVNGAAGSLATKAKATSPRAALTATTRRVATTTTTAAKSPTKPLASTASTLASKPKVSSTLTSTASRTLKTTASSVSSTTTTTTTSTKTFTARPAPKFNHSATTATRKSVGSTGANTTSTTSAANNTLKPSSAAGASTMRKTSPNKLSSTKSSTSPLTKTTTPSKSLTAAKTKTKEVNGKSPIIKPKQKEVPLANGGGDSAEKDPKALDNGVPHVNGDSHGDSHLNGLNGENLHEPPLQQQDPPNEGPLLEA